MEVLDTNFSTCTTAVLASCRCSLSLSRVLLWGSTSNTAVDIILLLHTEVDMHACCSHSKNYSPGRWCGRERRGPNCCCMIQRTRFTGERRVLFLVLRWRHTSTTMKSIPNTKLTTIGSSSLPHACKRTYSPLSRRYIDAHARNRLPNGKRADSANKKTPAVIVKQIGFARLFFFFQRWVERSNLTYAFNYVLGAPDTSLVPELKES